MVWLEALVLLSFLLLSRIFFYFGILIERLKIVNRFSQLLLDRFVHSVAWHVNLQEAS